MRSGREWLLPVLESRPANTMGSRAPSISGSATCLPPTAPELMCACLQPLGRGGAALP